MLTMLWVLVSLVVIALSYYYLFIKPYSYWPARGVRQGRPWPLFGDMWGMMLRLHSMADMVKMTYDACPGTRYWGMYSFLIPALMLKDPELIKQLTVKDFEHFTDHRSFVPENSDPFWSKSLFNLTGQQWKDMRSTLSPAFTSSKMKQMYVLIMDSSKQFAEYFLKQDKKEVEIEMKDTFTRFANDVIASTAFGIKCDSLKEPNNEFYLMGKDATNFISLWKTMKFLIYLSVPSIGKVLQLKLFSENVANFFLNLVKTNIKDREERGIVRPDMIHLLMEARKHGLKHEDTPQVRDAGFATTEESEIGRDNSSKAELSDVDITAQALIFFFAGFDSVSSLMCFMSYELGINPDLQERLHQEILEVDEQCKGKLSYDALLGMKYMDMIVSETLRLWPAGVAADRVCTKPYTIQPKTSDEKAIHLKENDVICLPIYALHRDPNHFPDPDKFDPERFNEDNRINIKPYTYLPFGSGPRNCIGSRFALLEIKALYYYLLLNFEIVPTAKTKVPLVLSRKSSFNLTAMDGFWFSLRRRA